MHFITYHRWLAVSMVLLLLLTGVILWQVLYIRFHHGAPVPAPAIPRGPEQFGTNGSKLNFVVMGDSTAVGQGADYAQGIARHTAQYLAKEHQVSLTNLGVSGATIAQVRQTQLAKAIQQKPDVVLLAMGANDVTHLISLASIEQDATSILAQLRAGNPQVQLVLTGSPAMGAVPRFAPPTRWVAGWQERRVNHVLARVAQANGAILLPLAAQTQATFLRHPEYFATDNFHPNAQGYTVWFPVLDAGFATLQLS